MSDRILPQEIERLWKIPCNNYRGREFNLGGCRHSIFGTGFLLTVEMAMDKDAKLPTYIKPELFADVASREKLLAFSKYVMDVEKNVFSKKRNSITRRELAELIYEMEDTFNMQDPYAQWAVVVLDRYVVELKLPTRQQGSSLGGFPSR